MCTLVVSPGQESTYKVNAPIIPTYPAVVCTMKRAQEVASSQMKGRQCAHCNLSTLLYYRSAPGLYYLLAQTQLQYIYCTLKSLDGIWEMSSLAGLINHQAWYFDWLMVNQGLYFLVYTILIMMLSPASVVWKKTLCQIYNNAVRLSQASSGHGSMTTSSTYAASASCLSLSVILPFLSLVQRNTF